MVANAMVAASLLKLRLDPSFLGEEMHARDVRNPWIHDDTMQECDVMDPSSVGEDVRACDVIGNSGQGAQPKRPHQAEAPPRNVAPTNESESESDIDNENERNNKRDVLIERLESALRDVQTSVFQDAQADLDGTLERVSLRSLESFWDYYNMFDDYDDELNEFDYAALELIGAYVDLRDDVDEFCDCGSKIRRLFEQLGAQEIWMTRDFLGAVRQRGDDQMYGMEVLREFYGDDYW